MRSLAVAHPRTEPVFAPIRRREHVTCDAFLGDFFRVAIAAGVVGDKRSPSRGLREAERDVAAAELIFSEFGNLTKAVVNNGATATLEYVIDGMGRRVARRTNGSVDRIWLYRDGLRPVSEVDGKGVFTHFIYESNDTESGAPDALIRSGVLYRVVKDHLGSLRLVVNAQTGAIAQSIDFDATTKLVRFGARGYNAEIGHWTTRDPIGRGRTRGSSGARGGIEAIRAYHQPPQLAHQSLRRQF